MSSITNSGISISKKLLAGSRDSNFHRTICFYHKATSGQTLVNMTSLTMPSGLVDVNQITAEELLVAGIFYNRRNIQLHSLSRGELFQGVDYKVNNNTEIQFIGPLSAGLEADEVIFGRILAIPQNGLDSIIQAFNMQPPVTMPGFSVDWSQGYVFSKEVSANCAFTFVNTIVGRVITLSIKNIGAGIVNVTLPLGVWRDSGIDLTIEPGKKNIYTFINEGAEITCSYVSQLTNV